MHRQEKRELLMRQDLERLYRFDALSKIRDRVHVQVHPESVAQLIGD